MVAYNQLVRKPQLSMWICTSRRYKLSLTCAFFVFMIILIIHQTKRRTSLVSIYNLQAAVGPFLNLEMKYLPKTNESDGWKETLVNRGHIFSAYLDTRPEQILEERHAVNDKETTWAMIRIIAILDLNMTGTPLTCIYKYKGKNTDENGDSFVLKRITATRVKPIAIEENFNMRYTAFFILCDLTVPNEMDDILFYTSENLPYEVTIAPIDQTDVNQLKIDYFVPIHYPENGIYPEDYAVKNSSEFMAVCVQMFHHNFDRVRSLVEFIEFYQMMGVGHFTFYNRSMSAMVGEVLEHYKMKGVVTVLPWKLPSYFIFEKTLRVDGIFASLNDCLYRSSFYKHYTYVAAVDVDEFIIPRKHDDFLSMMQYLDPPDSDCSLNSQASFVFRNMFFYLKLDDDPVTLPPEIPKLYTHSKTMRWIEANQGGSRSKFIVRSKQTVELGNHHTWELRRTCSVFGSRYKEGTVDLEIGASQHYRTCETNEETCWQRKIVRDRTAHKFTGVLGKRVAETCDDIFKKGCPASSRHQ